MASVVLAGFVLGPGLLDLVHPDPRSELVTVVAVVALVTILFRDGLEVEGEMLRRAWRPPLAKLVVGMPITAAIVALAAHAIVGLDWTRSFLVGALLSPTDPVLSSSVVTNPRVPRVVRHSLNLESGLNDGLALAPVLALAAALSTDTKDFTWWAFVLQDVGLGVAFGVACGWLASLLLPRDGGLPLLGLLVAAATWGVAVAPPHANAYLAVFVCAIVLGVRRTDHGEAFARAAAPFVAVAKYAVFALFGTLLTLGGLFEDGWAAVGLVAATLLVARPVAVLVALAGTRLTASARLFMAWFGPKAVATMAYSFLLLGRSIPGDERIFHLAALAVVVSIVVHGATDRPGAEWMARRPALRAARD